MRAILSVSTKTDLIPFALRLAELGIELYSTGGTKQELLEAGISIKGIAELTGFPEILGGRVKTLHPAVHGGILARRTLENDLAQLSEHGIGLIDLVVVNLYPFVETARKEDAALFEVVEQIDIGGPAMIRAAAKNFADVTVVVQPEDYPVILEELATNGEVSQATRRRLAAVAFQHTATYDTHIATYLQRLNNELFPPEITIALRKQQDLRYGENPHQQAAYYSWLSMPSTLPGSEKAPETETLLSTALSDGTAFKKATVLQMQQIHGKELSYNNILDADAALATVQSFNSPAVAIIKHTNPCGLACDNRLLEAYKKAHAGDSVSAYGGIVALNRRVDEETALEISQLFYEVVLAPEFSQAALNILRKKRDIRLLALSAPSSSLLASHTAAAQQAASTLELRQVHGGFLLQTRDDIPDQAVQRKVVTQREPTLEEITDLLFAWKVVKFVKSNAIVLAKNLAVIGVGAGQMNRVQSVHLATEKAGERSRGSVLASDAWFPFSDGIEAAAKAGVTAIVQPGGSIRDQEVIKEANHYGMAMLFTSQRHFKH